jgi:serine/threonine protein kinase
MSEETLFHQALQQPDPVARAAFLDRACAGRPELRARLERLLRAHDEPIPLLNKPALDLLIADPETNQLFGGDPASATPLPRPAAEGLAESIGPYRLVRKLGEGGMGAVYLAEQAEPVRREVALKVIKPGLDSAEVIARFEAERQALALMDHPHIARVLDAGTTDADRPFFVMELVRGTPITHYCDEEQLPLRQRLELFVSVCSALQHAHQKGVIHRDVKPSNVLVACCEGRPAVKVIDFGVAKAVAQPLTERTLITGLGAVVGTPEYMSPEQAELNNQDIDIRSDVYALGVLLYELLTGTTPLTPRRRKQTPLPELLRLIREEEPPRPSTRLHESPDTHESISARRRTESGKLSRLVRGELDWIVMRALEKDRARRYQTAGDLARDIEHYLRDEPVEAGPPSASYRLRKFSWKHRRVLAAAACFLVLLLAGVAVSTWQAVRATLAEARAKQNEALALAEAEKARRKEAEATALLEFQGWLVKLARPEGVEGEAGPDAGRLAEALSLGERSLRLLKAQLGPDHPDTVNGMLRLALTYQDAGRLAEALPLYGEAVKFQQARLGPDHPQTLLSMNCLAVAHRLTGQMAEALKLHEEALKLQRKRPGPNHPQTLVTMNNLAAAYREVGRLDEALALHEEALKLQRANQGPDHPHTLASMNNLALVYREVGRVTEALALHEEVLRLQKARQGPDHPRTLLSMNNLAVAYQDAGRGAEALALHEEALKFQKVRLGPKHPRTLLSMNNLAVAYQLTGRGAEALALHEEVLRLQKARLGPDHPHTLISMNNLAGAYREVGRFTEALTLHEEVVKLQKARLGPDHPRTLESMNKLAATHQQAGNLDKAESLFRDSLERQRRKLSAGSPRIADTLTALGSALLAQARYADAEPLLREGLEIRRRRMPDSWLRYQAASLLGGSLLGQKKYAAAEPLLLEGYQGMQARQERIPLPSKVRLSEALERLARLYEATHQKEKAAEWRKNQPEATGPVPRK